MAEYIKKALVAREIRKLLRVRESAVDIFQSGFEYGVDKAWANINKIPAADVTPVKHGEWDKKPFLIGTSYYCSECGDNFGEPYNYCPNCGAKMDEEVNGICADDKQSLKTCRTCKNYTPNHGYRGGEMGTCCFWKSITGNCMAVHQSRIGCEHYDKKI